MVTFSGAQEAGIVAGLRALRGRALGSDSGVSVVDTYDVDPTLSLELWSDGTVILAAAVDGGGTVEVQIPATRSWSDYVAAPFDQLVVEQDDEDVDDEDVDDEDVETLLVAIAELAGDPLARAAFILTRAFDPAKHPRYPPGHALAGQFRPTVDGLIEALTKHLASGGKGDPFPGFDRGQLRRVAVKRGHKLPRGATRDDIVKVLVADLSGKIAPTAATPPPGGKKISAAVAGTQGVTAIPMPPKQGMFGPAKQSFDIQFNGVSIGTIDQYSYGWTGEDAAGNPLLGVGRTKTAVIQALVATHQQNAPAPATPTAPVAPSPSPSPPPRTVTADPTTQAALDVIYGTDPKGKTVARQLAAYGALRRAHFDTLDPGEQSTLLGDLAYIEATSKSAATKAAVQKLINRFMPPGTPVGTIPPQPLTLPANVTSAQTRVADPAGTPGLLKMLPAGQRGKSGDGWTRTASGGSGPWGQYGAAGLMLRHVDAQGEERFLMVERGPGISDPGKWQFPGGAREELEDFYQGATREVVEELGFKTSDLDTARVHGTHTTEVPAVMVPGLHGARVPWGYVSIAATVPTQLQPDLSTHHARMETSDARWMTRAEIAALDSNGKLLKPLAGGALQQNVMTLFPSAGAAPVPSVGRPPRLTGPIPPRATPAKPHKPSRGRDLIGDKASKDKLRQDVKRDRAAYDGKTADERLAAIGAMQGFDDVPTVVSKADMDRLLATGDYVEAWRGVQGAGAPWRGPGRGGAVTRSKTAADIQEEFRSGPAYYGTGIYGNGYYFAAQKHVAEGYSDRTKGSVIRVLIPKDAKIEEHRKIATEAHTGPRFSQAKGRKHEPATLYDEGRYAAAKGLDAIEIRYNSSNSHVASPGKPAYNILNRSILIVQEA